MKKSAVFWIVISRSQFLLPSYPSWWVITISKDFLVNLDHFSETLVGNWDVQLLAHSCFLQRLRSSSFHPPPKTSKSCFLKSDATVSCISTANLGDDTWGDEWGRRGNQTKCCWELSRLKDAPVLLLMVQNQAIATWDIKKTLYVVK